MIESTEKVIGDHTYTITQLPARRALRLQAKLLKLLSPCISVIISEAIKEAKEKGISLSDVSDKSIPSAIQYLSSGLEENTFEDLICDMLPCVRVDGKELTVQLMDVLFAGSLNQLFLLMKEVLEANFKDFFQEGSILLALKEE